MAISLAKSDGRAARPDVFRYYGGWVDQDLWRDESLRSLVCSTTPCASRSASAARSFPWNGPVGDVRVEGRAGAGLRQLVHAEAGRADAAYRAAPGRTAAGSRYAGRRAQYHHRFRRNRRWRDRGASGDRQGRVHRFDRSRQAHPSGLRRKPETGFAGARRQIAQRRFFRRRYGDAVPTVGVRRFCMLSGQVCCAGDADLRATATSRIDFVDALTATGREHQGGRPARSEDHHRTAGFEGAVRSRQRLSQCRQAGRREGPTGGEVAQGQGLLRQAHDLHRRQQRHEDRARGDLRTVAAADPVQGRKRRRFCRATTPPTVSPPRSGPTISAAPTRSLARSKRERFGSTATASSIRSRPSAATSNRASAANSASTRSTSTRRSSRFTSNSSSLNRGRLGRSTGPPARITRPA